MKQKSVVELFVTILVFVFLYTAANKLLEPRIFRYSLSQSPVLKQAADYITYALPVAELLTVILMIVPRTRLLGLYVVSAMLTVFTVYLIWMVMFTPKLPCGCGGIIAKLGWRNHIFVNLALLGMAIGGVVLQRKLRLAQYSYREGTLA